jgi:hypothetical protein
MACGMRQRVEKGSVSIDQWVMVSDVQSKQLMSQVSINLVMMSCKSSVTYIKDKFGDRWA